MASKRNDELKCLENFANTCDFVLSFNCATYFDTFFRMTRDWI